MDQQEFVISTKSLLAADQGCSSSMFNWMDKRLIGCFALYPLITKEELTTLVLGGDDGEVPPELCDKYIVLAALLEEVFT